MNGLQGGGGCGLGWYQSQCCICSSTVTEGIIGCEGADANCMCGRMRTVQGSFAIVGVTMQGAEQYSEPLFADCELCCAFGIY